MTYDTTPKPALLRALQAERWTVAGALSELVDNSFGPGRGDASRCEITYDPVHRTLAVLDNGQGMNGGIGRLFRLGETIGRMVGDIGIYGAGGTRAIVWLPSVVRVTTLREGRVSTDEVRWADHFEADVFPRVSDRWEKANASNTPPELFAARHGTLIELQLLRGRTFLPSNVQRDLSETYAPAFRKGRRLLWTTLGRNGLTQELRAPLEDLNPETSVVLEGFLAIPDSEELLGIRGQVGLVKGLSFERSKVAFGYGPRVIFRTRDCFRSPEGEAFREAGVAGYVDLLEGWQPYLTLTKDEIDNGPVREALMTWVYGKVEHLLVEVQDQEVQLLLNDIALRLTESFEGGLKVRAEVPGAEEGGSVHGPGPGPKPGEGHSVIDIPPKVPGKAEGELPSGSKFEITPLDDAGMGGRLCMAEASADDVLLFVNRDHAVVQTALERKPINRLALELMVTRELADLIANNDILRKKAFGRRARDFDEANPGDIHRYLMDHVRREEPA
jgi:hypothetical protein